MNVAILNGLIGFRDQVFDAYRPHTIRNLSQKDSNRRWRHAGFFVQTMCRWPIEDVYYRPVWRSRIFKRLWIAGGNNYFLLNPKPIAVAKWGKWTLRQRMVPWLETGKGSLLHMHDKNQTRFVLEKLLAWWMKWDDKPHVGPAGIDGVHWNPFRFGQAVINTFHSLAMNQKFPCAS